ncbi:MAG: HD domain-containing protein [Spirochaetaceae bacterium]|jgi:HD-GYP domain-containing protein (c-di-GMP phosphodiesterase class II)|nr:HD domain-containing protein [Spirochaetaceae bacterium]
MAYKAISFLLFIGGGIFMGAATAGYHQLLTYYRQQVYVSLGKNYRINITLLYVFVTGYILGAVDTLLRTGTFYHAVIALALALAALYTWFSMREQARAAVLLRGKVLEAIRAFVNTIDLKDNLFKGHSKHVYDIVNLFYEELEDYHEVLNREKLLDAAILHDIGKINISSGILSKSEGLTHEEWEILKSHPLRGKEMLDETGFREISDWVLYHHEWVNGNGYYGLASENIPLESKIIAIADSYSALSSERAWRARLSHEETLAVIISGAGKQFDRKLVDCFRRIDRERLAPLTVEANAGLPRGKAGNGKRPGPPVASAPAFPMTARPVDFPKR